MKVVLVEKIWCGVEGVRGRARACRARAREAYECVQGSRGGHTRVCRVSAWGPYKGCAGLARAGSMRGVCGARTRKERARGVQGNARGRRAGVCEEP